MKKKVLYKKVGGGSLRWNGRIIKPNQVFSAYPEELPSAFRSRLVEVGEVNQEQVQEQVQKPEQVQEPVKNPSMKYEIRDSGRGWYDIVNVESNKRINEKSLRKADAEMLLKELE